MYRAFCINTSTDIYRQKETNQPKDAMHRKNRISKVVTTMIGENICNRWRRCLCLLLSLGLGLRILLVALGLHVIQAELLVFLIGTLVFNDVELGILSG